MSRALSLLMPTCSATFWRARPVVRFLDLAVVERLQRDLAAHELLLEHLRDGLQPFLRRRLDLDRVVLQLDDAVGALEVEARRELAARLVDRVAHLLHVDLGDDIERRHGAFSSGGARNGAAIVDPGRYPSGQRGRAVNPLRYATLVRIQPGPLARPHGRAFAHLQHRLHQHDVEPLAELAADLAFDADLFEAAARGAARSTPSWPPTMRPIDRVEAVVAGQVDEVAEQQRADARRRGGRGATYTESSTVGRVRRPGPVRRQRREPDHASSPSTATIAGWLPECSSIHATCSSSVRGTRSNVTVDSSDLDVVDARGSLRRRAVRRAGCASTATDTLGAGRGARSRYAPLSLPALPP